MHEIVYLSGPDVDALALSDDEILRAVRETLRAQGRAQTVIEPRVHLFPPGAGGHFNVLRGVTPRFAGVKVVGDYVDNHRLGLPSELALLLMMDAGTGMPVAVIDATAITEMRTGAVTAIGAEHLGRPDARVLGHVGARGTAYWNVRLLARVLPTLREVRVHSRRAESRQAFADRLRGDLPHLRVDAVDDWEACVRGADVVVEASRLTEPTPLLRTAWIAPGALVIPYGTVSAVELDLTEIMDKIVVDDWGQAGSGPLGALRAHVDSGRLSAGNLHAELGQIVAGVRPGRERPDETILFWHRGLSLTDIALGEALLDKALTASVGMRLPYRE
ncbi:MAG TPA: ornithine cyclodeaminase family protein [Solirubrobacteraceae bacterium]|nr:ornithine cyclodeaminase family protein [Solirubrobacteraceae bacterium]